MPRRCFPALILTAFLMLCVPRLPALQGCSLCKDTTAGSAPRAQAALRKAILVLGIPAGGIFVGLLLVARRFSPKE
ncbi:hypothetical protein GCM10011586_29680 [Silvibacterium dinghuense]|nr:hypothetical protein GCM10011586_29680 [Silvibacterium dinghuense]